jgi:hypothetical protein
MALKFPLGEFQINLTTALNTNARFPIYCLHYIVRWDTKYTADARDWL